jgi:hypothetical protein
VPSTHHRSWPLGVGVSKSEQVNEKIYGRSDQAHVSEQLDIDVGGRPKNPDPASTEMVTGDQGG